MRRESPMYRERMHFTVRSVKHWDEALQLVEQGNKVHAAAGRTQAKAWTQLTGPFNEIILETDFPDLASYEREYKEAMSDPELLKLFPRVEEITIADKGHVELFESAEQVGF